MAFFQRQMSRAFERIAPLDADALIATSLRRGGRQDFSDWTFTAALRHLLHALDGEAQLSVFGHLAARFDALRCLDNLLRLDIAEEADPGIVRRPLTRPIFITGLPRSGSTFLHSLLSLDPAIAVPRSWQLIYPYPRGRLLSSSERRRARVERQFALLRLLSPELATLHPLQANAPQECTDITAQVFQSLRFDTMYRIPSYRDWIDRHGHHIAYLFHRRFLQHLDAQLPPGRRWVLKCPDHVFALDALRAAYPDAHVIMLHRDPLRVLASVARLTEVLRRPFSLRVARTEIGHEVSDRWAEGAERIVSAHSQGGNILHLYYHDVVGAPMDTLERLYRHCGMTLSEQAEIRVAEYLRKRPRGGYPVHHYSLEAFGLDALRLRERFARYMEVFDVRPERNRSTPESALSTSPA